MAADALTPRPLTINRKFLLYVESNTDSTVIFPFASDTRSCNKSDGMIT